MPRIKKKPNERKSYRRMVTLTPPVAEKVEAMAKHEQRSTAGTMSILIERGLALAK